MNKIKQYPGGILMWLKRRMILFGFLLLGIGLGVLYDEIPFGLLSGLGVGFIVDGLILLMERDEKSLEEIQAFFARPSANRPQGSGDTFVFKISITPLEDNKKKPGEEHNSTPDPAGH